MTRSDEDAITSLTAAVAALQQLDGAALQRRWRTLVGGSVPAELGRPLTLRMLAYKLQAQHLGDLDRASLRELSALTGAARKEGDNDKRGAAAMRTEPIGAEARGRASAPASRLQHGLLPPRVARLGTLLVREHGGVLHRVMILEQGVTWNGRTYDSLSQVALAITGTKWNGPRFFGLRGKLEETAETQNKAKTGRTAETKKPVIGRGRSSGVGRSSPQRASP